MKRNIVIKCGRDVRTAEGVRYLIDRFGFEYEKIKIDDVGFGFERSYQVVVRTDHKTVREIMEKLELKNRHQMKFFEFKA